jgi:hypothetical protein
LGNAVQKLSRCHLQPRLKREEKINTEKPLAGDVDLALVSPDRERKGKEGSAETSKPAAACLIG